MCVIIYKPKNETIPMWILKAAQARNPHGIGIGYFNENKEVCIRKPLTLDALEWVLNDMTYQNVIVHFRRATSGKINSNACHPFLFGHDAFAHNGTIRHFFTGTKKKSDSQQLRDFLVSKQPEDPGKVFSWFASKNCGRFVHLKSNNTTFNFYGKWYKEEGLLLSTLSWFGYVNLEEMDL